MIACSGVVWSRTTWSGARSLGIGFAAGGPAMRFENFSLVALAPRLKDEPWMRLRHQLQGLAIARRESGG